MGQPFVLLLLSSFVAQCEKLKDRCAIFVDLVCGLSLRLSSLNDYVTINCCSLERSLYADWRQMR